MTISDEILVLANQIANSGKKPTVALIKTKLNKKVSLPVIISTLKGWQHEPSFVTLAEDKEKSTESNSSLLISGSFEKELNEDLVKMKKEIHELKALVKQLIDQQKE